jgi:hypothetical protein
MIPSQLSFSSIAPMIRVLVSAPKTLLVSARDCTGAVTWRRLFACALIPFVLPCASAMCAPLSLSKAQFDALALNRHTIVEDFEQFSTGVLNSPVILANSTYFATLPYVAENIGVGPTKAMLDNDTIKEPRVFTSFLPNTTLFATEVRTFNDTFELLRVTVQGGSGPALIQRDLVATGLFIAFSDPLGLVSVTFQNLGRPVGSTTVYTNYAFDNVTIGVPIPEPKVGSLVVALLAMSAMWRGKATSRFFNLDRGFARLPPQTGLPLSPLTSTDGSVGLTLTVIDAGATSGTPMLQSLATLT